MKNSPKTRKNEGKNRAKKQRKNVPHQICKKETYLDLVDMMLVSLLEGRKIRVLQILGLSEAEIAVVLPYFFVWRERKRA